MRRLGNGRTGGRSVLFECVWGAKGVGGFGRRLCVEWNRDWALLQEECRGVR